MIVLIKSNACMCRLFSRSMDVSHSFHSSSVTARPAVPITGSARTKRIAAGKSFQFRIISNDMLESICDVVRKLIKRNIIARLQLCGVGLYKVLYKIRQDSSLPVSDLDCVGSLQVWINKQLIEDIFLTPNSLEVVMCIVHALSIAKRGINPNECFLLLDDASEGTITQSVMTIRALEAVGQLVNRADNFESITIFANKYHGFYLLRTVVDEYTSNVEVVNQWCSTVTAIASCNSELKVALGQSGICHYGTLISWLMSF